MSRYWYMVIVYWIALLTAIFVLSSCASTYSELRAQERERLDRMRKICILVDTSKEGAR